MSQLQNGLVGSHPAILTPVYEMTAPNEGIALFSGDLVFERGGQKIAGTGLVRVDWLPSPRVSFAMQADEIWHDLGVGVLRVPDLNRSFEATAYSASASFPPRRCQVSGLVDRELNPSRQPVACLLVHLCNFSNYIGEVVAKEDGGRLRSRLTLADGEWRIDIDKRPDSSDRQAAARASGGFAMTHVCRITRVDGTEFLPPGPADQLLRFLSFVRSAWCGVFLPVGFDAKGTAMWDGWTMQKIQPYVEASGWFPFHQPGPIAQTYPRFSQLWAEPAGRRMLSMGVAWYVHAISMGELEARLVQAVAGLELLAYFGLVHWGAKASITDKAFDRLTTEKRIRRLVEVCGIPDGLPSELAECTALAQAPHGWKQGDGAELIAWVRNSVIRPIPKLPLSNQIMHEALELALQYVELVILRYLDYQGEYASRIMRLSPEPGRQQYALVPWAG